MNIMKTAAAVVLAAGLITIPLAAQRAQHGGSDFAGSWHGKRLLGHMAAELNLTDAQKAAAKQLMADSKRQAEPVVEQMKQNRTAMETAVKANNSSQIAQLAAQQGQLAGQLAEIRAKGMAAFHAQLTPEQQAKAEELRQKRGDRMEKWRNRRGPQADQTTPNQL